MPFGARSIRAPIRGYLIAFLALLLLPLAGASTRAADPEGPTYRKDRILVAFKERAGLQARVSAVTRHGLAVDPAEQNPYFAVLRLGASARAASLDPVRAAVAALRKDPTVRVAEPDYVRWLDAVPNDAQFAKLWSLRNTGQTQGTPGADIHAVQAWDTVAASPAVIVAVVDTGIDTTHEDLKDELLRDGQGHLVGFDFVGNDSDPTDDNGHGSHVSGILGARGNNGVGITGVTQRVKIMPLKAFDKDGGSDVAGLIAAFDYARLHGAQIINASYSSAGPSQLEQEAVSRARDAGILVCAAAGNQASNNDFWPRYPAGYNRTLDNVISVAATDADDRLAGFSNYGPATVDLAAPGVDIYSTLPGGKYGLLSGTSMAAPHVTGAAALLKARFPSLTPAQLKTRLLSGTDHPEALGGLLLQGRLNVATSLQPDAAAPGTPAGLAVTHHGETSLHLIWTASGDDGGTGAASAYDLRYSPAPITPSNFAQAPRAAGLLAPGAAGHAEDYLLTGLVPETPYYLALRASDDAGNLSGLAFAGPVSTLASTQTVLFQDDAEAAPRFSGWQPSDEDHVSGTHCYSDSPGALYANNLDLSLVQGGSVTPTGVAPALSFQARTDLEAGFDFLYVEGSTDAGVSWQRLLSLSGVSAWTLRSVPLGAFRGRPLKLRFRLVTDDTNAADGVWLDDIRVTTTDNALCPLQDNVEGQRAFSGEGPWAVTNENRFSPTHAYTDSPGQNYLDNMDVSLTQNASVSLAGFAPTLTFWAQTDLEDTYDFVYIEASTDGGQSWKRISLLTGTAPATFYSVPLGSYFGRSLRLRFHFVTDKDVRQNGVWLDDLQICGEKLEAIGVSGPPEAPTALTAQVATPDRVTLAWSDRSDNETQFKIERRTGSDDFETVGAVGAGVTTYADASAVPLTAYEYRVVAANAAGDSAPSNVAAVTTPGSGKVSVAGRVSFSKVKVKRLQRKSLYIKNLSATESLYVRVTSPDAPFALAVGGGAGVIAPRGKRLLQVVFQPVKKGKASGRIAITSSDARKPSLSVVLTGKGG